MNKMTRKQVNGIASKVQDLIKRGEELAAMYEQFGKEIQDLSEQLDCVLTDENQKLDNMERFEGTERYQKQESAVDALSEAVAYLNRESADAAMDAIKWCKDYLVDARKELDEWDKQLTTDMEMSADYMKDAVDA